jgi:xylulokinase
MQILALDVGTKTIKASLVDPEGHVSRSVSRRTGELRSSIRGYMELDPDEAYSNVKIVLKEIAKDLKNEDVLISHSAMAPVLILMGRNGKPLTPAILYNDLRASSEVDELNEKIGIEELLKINGNRANTQQWAPKILWLKKHEKPTISQAEKLLDLTSYLVWRLTGEAVIDYTEAQEGGLLDYSRMNWSDRMLSFLDLDSSLLPDLKPTCSIVGELSERNKSRLGMGDRRVLVTTGCVDAVTTPLALGLIREERLSIELGTTGIIFTPTLSPKPDKRLFLDLSPKEGLYYVGGGTAASGTFYEWILRLLMNGVLDYRKAEELAASSKPGSKGLVILPYIMGERTPVFDPLARSIFFGLTVDNTPGDIVRAAMEGVAYSLLHHLRIMQEKGYRAESGSITGGGAASELFRKIVSDVLGLPLTHDPSSSTTLGGAYIGYMSAGIKKRWEDIERWLTPGHRIEPDPSLRQLYNHLFSVYLNLYEKHKQDFASVASTLANQEDESRN